MNVPPPQLCMCVCANVVEEREGDEHCTADNDDGAKDETLAADPVVERPTNNCCVQVCVSRSEKNAGCVCEREPAR